MTTILGDLGHDGSITVTRSGGVLTLTQLQGGTSGNNTITAGLILRAVVPLLLRSLDLQVVFLLAAPGLQK